MLASPFRQHMFLDFSFLSYSFQHYISCCMCFILLLLVDDFSLNFNFLFIFDYIRNLIYFYIKYIPMDTFWGSVISRFLISNERANQKRKKKKNNINLFLSSFVFCFFDFPTFWKQKKWRRRKKFKRRKKQRRTKNLCRENVYSLPFFRYLSRSRAYCFFRILLNTKTFTLRK